MPAFSKITPTILFNSFVAGIGYGGWAVYANYEHGTQAWVTAGLVQGIYAFFSTLFITQIAQTTFIRNNCGYKGMLFGFVISFIVMLTLPLLVHSLFGTPNIWKTILPGLIWGSVYLMGFLTTLHVSQRRKSNSKF